MSETIQKLKSHFWNKSFLDYVLSRNGVLYPSSPDGKPAGQLQDIEINNRAEFKAYYGRGFKRFVFQPYRAGLVGIDVDMKNGRNGLQELYKFINNPFCKFHVKTPSNGLHLYYTVDNRQYVSCEVAPGLEIKYRSFITIPGSVSTKGQYIAHGSPGDIMSLPESLNNVIPVRSNHKMNKPKYQTSGKYDLSLNKIYDILLLQGVRPEHGGRNRFAFEMARFSKKKGYNPDEVQRFLSFMENQDFTLREIERTVQSAYNK